MVCSKIKKIAILCFVCSLVGMIAAQTVQNAEANEDLVLDLFFEEVCVARHLCQNGHVNEDGSGLLKFRQRIGKPINGTCSLGDVPCKVPQWHNSSPLPRALPVTTPAPILTPSTPPTTKRPSTEVPTVTPVITTGSSTEASVDYSTCGQRNPKGLFNRVRNTDRDSDSELGEFPWMVSIMCISSNRECGRAENETDQYLCGGSLIAPNVVVSTAHHTRNKDASQLLVRAGDWDRSSEVERLTHQDSKVKELVLHDQYNKASAVNSISLLILETTFQWTAHIRPICLPAANFQFDRAHCFVSGWGKDSLDEKSKINNILTKVDLSVVPNDECQSMLRETLLGAYFKLNPSFLCAGGIDGKDACLGDGGSPLSCPLADTEEPYYLSGLVNWGVGCGVKNVPGVYTNVAKLRTWIDQQLTQRAIQI